MLTTRKKVRAGRPVARSAAGVGTAPRPQQVGATDTARPAGVGRVVAGHRHAPGIFLSRDPSTDDPHINMSAANLWHARRATAETPGATCADIFPAMNVGGCSHKPQRSENAAASPEMVEHNDSKRARQFFVEEDEHVVWKVVNTISKGDDK